LAEKVRDIVKWAYHHAPVDLLILDVDMTREFFGIEKKLFHKDPKEGSKNGED